MVRPEDQERRSSLRRLDDILETLEQMNLHDRTELNDTIAERLIMLGIERPHNITIPQLIERVWAMFIRSAVPSKSFHTSGHEKPDWTAS